MDLDPKTVAEELTKAVESTQLVDISNIEKFDNLELLQLLYGTLDGGDTMPSQQRNRFRALYWEIFDRLVEQIILFY